MRQVWTLMKLRLKLTLTSKKQLFLLIIVPLFVLILFEYFYKEAFEEARIPVTVVDLDQSEYSLKLLEKIRQNDSIRIVEGNVDSVKQLVLTNQVDTAMVIKQGFKETIFSGEKKDLIEVYQGKASMATPFVTEILASEVMRLISNHAAADKVIDKYEQHGLFISDELWLKAWHYTDQQWEPHPLMSVDAIEVESYFQPIEESNNDGVALNKVTLLIILAFIMVLTFFNSHWVIEDRQVDLEKRIIFSKVSEWKYFLGGSIAVVLISSVQMLVLLLVFAISNTLTNLLQIAVFSGLYIVCCCFIGLFFAALCKTKNKPYSFIQV